jgi:hypothetical protein
MIKSRLMGLTIVSFLIMISSCRKKDVISTSDNFVVFETNAQGLIANDNSITVKLKLLNPTNTDINLVLNVTEQGVQYNNDYTTVPAASAGKINVTIPSGNNETNFKLTKTAGVTFDGDEKIIFEILSSTAPAFIGTTKQFTLSFAELISTTSTAIVNGGGANYPNKVFIDISANRQTAVNRTTWDLNFYNGNDDFRVLLNSSVNMMAKQLNKTDLNTVTLNDTVGLTNDLTFSQTAPLALQLPFIDYPTGDLTRTAIAAIAANDNDNKVYIINRGNGVGIGAASRGWKKIRILRNTSGGYTLQHADLSATTFATVNVSKEDVAYFKQVSFENGVVNAEPAKKKWDFTWTYFANATNFGAGEVPYLFQDVVLINRGVQVAKVLTSAKAFTDFAEADIAAQTFLSTQNAIATDWRSGGGPTTSPSVRTDRYYVIKDADNNFYKLRFTALTQNSERGYPAFEAVLVKKG